MNNSLKTTQLQTQTSGAGQDSKVAYNLSSLKGPIISSQATVQISGSKFQLAGYGTADNTYISYTNLPQSIQTQAKVNKNAWIQLRKAGKQPTAVSASLASLADPRYLVVQPVIFGNFPAKTRTQLVAFEKSNNIYKYDAAKVTKTNLNGKKVFVYQVTADVNHLKVLNQSADVSMNFSPGDIQAAINDLDNLKDAKLAFYVSAGKHQLTQIDITKNGQTKSIVYSQPQQVSLPNEPQTNLTWQAFAPTQYQLELAAASKQTPVQRDATRQANLASLHTALALYFTQNNAYPTFADLSDQSWIATNLSSPDPDLFRDPLGTSLVVSNVPKAGALAYQPTTQVGKVCDNGLTNTCVHYKLIATSESKQPITVQDP